VGIQFEVDNLVDGPANKAESPKQLTSTIHVEFLSGVHLTASSIFSW